MTPPTWLTSRSCLCFHRLDKTTAWLWTNWLTEIIHYAIPSSWNKKLQEQGKDLLVMGMPAFLTALEDLEASETDFQKASTNTSSSTRSSTKKSGKKSRKSNKTATSNRTQVLKGGSKASNGYWWFAEPQVWQCPMLAVSVLERKLRKL